MGEPLAGLASVFASSAPHALRGRDRDLVRLLPGTEARSVLGRKFLSGILRRAGLRWRYADRKSWRRFASSVTGVTISALWNPKMLTPALTYINCRAKPEQS